MHRTLHCTGTPLGKMQNFYTRMHLDMVLEGCPLALGTTCEGTQGAKQHTRRCDTHLGKATVSGPSTAGEATSAAWPTYLHVWHFAPAAFPVQRGCRGCSVSRSAFRCKRLGRDCHGGSNSLHGR